MSAPRDRIAIRISAPFLAALLVLTPTAQALAQAEQQEQESQATQTEEPAAAVSQDNEQETALTNARAAEPDAVQLLRLGAANIFPISDSPQANDSAAATPSTKTNAITIAVLVVVLIAVLLIAASQVNLGG